MALLRLGLGKPGVVNMEVLTGWAKGVERISVFSL
jgi:hypothetical protein